MTWISSLFFGVSLLFFTEQIGELANPVNRICGSAFFLFAMLITLRNTKNHPLWLSAALPLVAAATLLIPLWASTMAVIGTVFVVPRKLDPRSSAGTLANRLLISLSLFGIMSLGVVHSPYLYQAMEWSASVYSSLLGSVLGETHVLGPTPLGLPAILFAVSYLLASLITGPRIRPRSIVASLLAIVAASLLFHWSVEHFEVTATELLPRSIVQVLEMYLFNSRVVISDANHMRNYWQVLHAISVLLAVVWTVRPRVSEEASQPDVSDAIPTHAPRWPVTLSLATLVVGAACLMVFVPTGSPGNHVHFYNKGRFDWDRPTFEKFGKRSQGMFGMLPDQLRLNGFDVTIGGLSDESLRDVNVLAMINMRESYTDVELDAVERYVTGGGCLLVLGDHTRYEGEDPFNVLLEPTGIRFNFDTAQPLVMGWSSSLHFTPGHIPRIPHFAHQVYHWVGATLEIAPHVRPLIIGTAGYADYGVEENIAKNKLGDRRQNPDEKFGDLLLAATTTWGDGRVIVYGDTTSFQNRPVLESWKYVTNVFSYAATPMEWRVSPAFGTALFLLGLLALLALALRHGSPKPLIQAGLIVVLFHLCSYGIARVSIPERTPIHDDTKSKLAIIDLSHGERLSADSSRPESYDGIAYNLMRNGLVPIALEEDLDSLIDHAGVIVLSSPVTPIATQTEARLIEFVEQGGSLIVATGWEERSGCESLLGRLGVRVKNVPLGSSLRRRKPDELLFHEAWPLDLDREDAVPLSRLHGQTVAARVPLGSGQVLVIGDSHFLQGRCIENNGGTVRNPLPVKLSMPNIEFLRAFLNEV